MAALLVAVVRRVDPLGPSSSGRPPGTPADRPRVVVVPVRRTSRGGGVAQRRRFVGGVQVGFGLEPVWGLVGSFAAVGKRTLSQVRWCPWAARLQTVAARTLVRQECPAWLQTVAARTLYCQGWF